MAGRLAAGVTLRRYWQAARLPECWLAGARPFPLRVACESNTLPRTRSSSSPSPSMKAFFSSTAVDLSAYRQADDTILLLAQESVGMERFGPLLGRPVRCPITASFRTARPYVERCCFHGG